MTINAASTIDPAEIDKFSAMAASWWDEAGPFAPLHHINPIRMRYIVNMVQSNLAVSKSANNARSAIDICYQPLQGLKILDVGCGGGITSEAMARLGADVTAIDASQSNIDIAISHAKQAGLQIAYQRNIIENIAETERHSARYDVVTALEIVEHVADLDLFLRCCADMVRPGGLLILSTINRTAKSYAMAIIAAEYILRWVPVGTHDWRKFCKPHELVQPLQQYDMQFVNLCGLLLHPLTRNWRMTADDIAVNYMLTMKK